MQSTSIRVIHAHWFFGKIKYLMGSSSNNVCFQWFWKLFGWASSTQSAQAWNQWNACVFFATRRLGETQKNARGMGHRSLVVGSLGGRQKRGRLKPSWSPRKHPCFFAWLNKSSLDATLIFLWCHLIAITPETWLPKSLIEIFPGRQL